MIPELTKSSPDLTQNGGTEPSGKEVNEPDNAAPSAAESMEEYLLDEQIGYLLRLANQRHLEIFNNNMPDLTPTQFAVLIRLDREGDISQNELGRRVGIDAATTNGVIERLARKKLIRTRTDTRDKRRLRISLTSSGRSSVATALPIARKISHQTLQQLDAGEIALLLQLLQKMQKA